MSQGDFEFGGNREFGNHDPKSFPRCIVTGIPVLRYSKQHRQSILRIEWLRIGGSSPRKPAR